MIKAFNNVDFSTLDSIMLSDILLFAACQIYLVEGKEILYSSL